MDVNSLPHFQAGCNVVTTMFLLCGYAFIRNGKKTAHKACMLSALTASVMFLASYLTYHSIVGSVKYGGMGVARTVYFSVLTSHTLLATVALPMILAVLYRAFTGNFEAHKKIARWTLPTWLYVSITGVAVYLMLYRGLGR